MLKLDRLAKHVIASMPEFAIPYGEPCVNHLLDWPYPNHFFSCFKHNSGKLLVMLQGRIDREKIPLPVFQRWSWSDEINASVLILSDPTLIGNQLSVGWWQGSEQEYALPLACEFIERIIEKLGLSSRDVMFFGSSAGGFAALNMAGLLKGSIAVVNNPQTNVLAFTENDVTALLQHCFHGMSVQVARERYPARFSVLELFKSRGYVPKIAYYQNIQDTLHFEQHYQPFVQGLYASGLDPAEFQSTLYAHHSGHAPLEKPKVTAIINHWLAQMSNPEQPMPLNASVENFVSVNAPIPLTE